MDAFQAMRSVPLGYKLRVLGNDVGWALPKRHSVKINALDLSNGVRGGNTFYQREHADDLDSMVGALKASLPSLSYASRKNRDWYCPIAPPKWRRSDGWEEFRCEGWNRGGGRCGLDGVFGVEVEDHPGYETSIFWFCSHHRNQHGSPPTLMRVISSLGNPKISALPRWMV